MAKTSNIFKCPHCDYSTPRKYNLTLHLNKKNPCKPKENESTNIQSQCSVNAPTDSVNVFDPSVNVFEKSGQCLVNEKKYVCEICNKSFKSKQGKHQHKKNVKCKPPTTCKTKKEDVTVEKMQEEIDKLQREIEQFKYDSKMLKQITENELPDNHKRNPGFSERMKKLIASEQGWKCNMCDVILPANYHVDHVLAICFGGTNHRTNGQALCVGCHKVKTQEENKMRLELQQIHKNP